MKRREFVKMCGSALALVYANPNLLAAPANELKAYNKVLLVDKAGKPIKASAIKQGGSYIFHYPFVGTPAFLINLGKSAEQQSIDAAGIRYQWPGGVGKNQSIVAFTAICSHQLSYPTKSISFINYQSGKSKVAGQDNVIVCCAHQTVFDPSKAASVVSGPTKKPLTAIVLEYDSKNDQLHAVACLGDEPYREFFRAYKRDLIQAFGRGKAKQKVETHSQVMSMEEYSNQRINC